MNVSFSLFAWRKRLFFAVLSVLSFLVIGCIAVNNPPTVPSNPSPSNSSEIEPVSVTLSWECSDPDGDALTYDLYFGTTNPPTTVVATNLNQPKYTLSSLTEGQTYYWKVIAKDGKGGTTEGPTWKFSVSATINKVLVLSRNKNVLDSMERKLKNFLDEFAYSYDIVAADDIQNGSVNPKRYKVIYFLTDEIPTSYNNPTVLTKLKEAVEAGSYLIAEFYGLFLFQYMEYTHNILEGYWWPFVYDKVAFVKPYDSGTANKLFQGILDWDPPEKPDKESQYIWYLESPGSYRYVLADILNPNFVPVWVLNIRYGVTGDDLSSSYCQIWGKCEIGRTVTMMNFSYSVKSKGRIIIGMLSGNSDGWQTGPVGKQLVKNIIDLKFAGEDW